MEIKTHTILKLAPIKFKPGIARDVQKNCALMIFFKEF